MLGARSPRAELRHLFDDELERLTRDVGNGREPGRCGHTSCGSPDQRRNDPPAMLRSGLSPAGVDPNRSAEEQGATMARPRTAADIERSWTTDPRWQGIERPYRGEDVVRLRGRIHVEHTLAQLGAERLWTLMHTQAPVRALGAVTGNQAVQQVAAGLEGDLLQRLAGGGRRQHRRPDVSRSEPLSGRQRAGARAPHQPRAPSAPTRSTCSRTGTAPARRPLVRRRSSPTPRPASAAT